MVAYVLFLPGDYIRHSGLTQLWCRGLNQVRSCARHVTPSCTVSLAQNLIAYYFFFFAVIISAYALKPGGSSPVGARPATCM